ncbi:chemotaxis protein CheB [Luteimonas sp. FCS-9]|uniref:chemotaxis protein CheB n=1 Tax=Luteimonas sp. FCS-9 TaxID=1547516 RepID=UPI00063EAC11|nr:chemotaxis protein CheB [Luteimonas sp. FCS-9]KLI99603.1 hypothetical protein WQ56_11955 [Luteimonas sp. FCS-9]
MAERAAPATRVVVLARPGPACDRIVEGLVEAGADVLRPVDPLAADVRALDALAPEAIVVALEPAVEDALDALAPALERPGRIVVFEETALVLERSGWDAARWVRHLAVKLRLRHDALPPGAGAMDVDAASIAPAPAAPRADGAAHAFDPVAAEYGEPPDGPPAPPAFVLALDDGPFAPVRDPDDDANLPDAAGLASLDAPADADAGSTSAPPASDLDALPSFRGLAATPDADASLAPAKPATDLAELEQRIAGLSLADADSYGQGPQRGLVLVDGGLGGPDAVRQLLAALPEGFPRPVLVRLRLDGGRYDRLVRQMARVTAAPVQLAEAGMTIAPGEVYFLPPDLLPLRAGGQLRFAADGDLAALARAVPPDDSAWLLLSGADPALVELATGPAWHGALVAAQSEPGCYDPAATHALVARGGRSGAPAQIAAWLVERWMPDAAPGPAIEDGSWTL